MSKPKKRTRPRPKGKPPAPKATQAEIGRRVDEILRIRLDGAQFHDIVQYASEKTWDVGERQLWEYVRRADELLAERHNAKRDELIVLHIAQRQALYARAVNAADYRTALAILSDEARLRGLYPDPKMILATPPGSGLDISKLPDAVKLAILSALRSAAQPGGGEPDRLAGRVGALGSGNT